MRNAKRPPAKKQKQRSTLTTAGTRAGTASSPVYDVPRLSDVVIDGSGNWKQALCIDVLPQYRVADGAWGLRLAPDHFDATARIAWDDAGLLVLVTVTVDRVVEAPDSEIYRGDCVELFMTPRPGSTTMVQADIAPGVDPRFGTVHSRVFDYRVRAPGDAEARVIAAARKTGTGYVIEARLPWTNLGLKPRLGLELGLQMYVDHYDPTGGVRHCALWHPRPFAAWGTFSEVNRVRLAARPSAPVRLIGAADIDPSFTQLTTRLCAAPQLRGATATLVQDGKTLAKTALRPDRRGGGVVLVALPAPRPGTNAGPLAVRIGKQTAAIVDMPDIDSRRLSSMPMPVVWGSVFQGRFFPKVGFDVPGLVQAIAGDNTIATRYFNASGAEVCEAAAPGRYAAVIDVSFAHGRRLRALRTLYRLPDSPPLWDTNLLAASLALPKEYGMGETVPPAWEGEVNRYLRNRVLESIRRTDETAILCAGLAEARTSGDTPGYYTSPSVRDRQWWVRFKRKLYGLDRVYAKPFVAPVEEPGLATPVIRTGTLQQAGMKPGAAAAIASVCQSWSKDTDQAFAVCVARNGVIALHSAYGMRDGRPMALDDRSWMASTTKMISGTCMMMLVDQGLIDLDDPVSKYLPQFRGVKTNKRITIRHLYTHTAGLTDHWGGGVADAEEQLAFKAPGLKVGQRYEYDGTGLELASKMLEMISGETLPLFYKRHLFDPLGVTVEASNASSDARAVPLDMAHICQMLLNGGAYGSMRFLRSATLQKMLPQRLTKTLGGDASMVYGIGTIWITESGMPAGTFTHGAASSATSWIDPTHRLVICMTRNSAGSNFEKYHPMFIKAILDNLA